MAASFALLRHADVDVKQELQGAGAFAALYDLAGNGYVFAWGISFYPQLILNWRRKSTAGMSIGFLWYNLLGFVLYLAYTSFAPDCTVQDQIFAGHALFVTALTLCQVPLYATNKLGDFPQLHGKISAVLLMLLEGCLVLNVAGRMSFMNLMYACGYLKTLISLIKYTPQFYLNFQRKSTVGFAIGMVFCDFAGGLLSILQQLISCSYDYSTGIMRPEWTWEPFSGNKPKLFLGMIAIFYDVLFMYQHFVLYKSVANASAPETSSSSGVQSLKAATEGLTSMTMQYLKKKDEEACSKTAGSSQKPAVKRVSL